MRIGVGISGGVDSAVCALLLKEAGHDVVGVTMTLGRADEDRSLAEARQVAESLGIRLHALDLAAAWRTEVCDYIRTTYLAGQTPNPCVRCNASVKFGLLPRWAFETLGCARFATGHYARLDADAEGRVRLLRGIDTGKDQSYFLYRVAPEMLGRTLLPLGGMTKAAVRAFAAQHGLGIFSKGDSQDFCGGDPMDFVHEPDRPGDIVRTDGRVLGRHRGHWHYTVGKRKGLGVGGGVPYYVVGIDPARNEVRVGFKDEVRARAFEVGSCTWLPRAAACRTAGEPWRVKVRSAGEPKGPVSVAALAERTTVTCPEGFSAVAPGQSAVFYCGDEVVGGGVIMV